MKRTISHLALAALSVLSACRTESISDVKTSEVNADISATATGSGSTNVAATFRKGPTSLTFLQLTSDDAVKVTQGTTTQALKETSLLGIVTYSASLPVDAEGTVFTVALERKKDTGAPSSVATLPTAFTLTPLTGSFSRASAGPTIQWSNAGTDPMKVNISGNCIESHNASITAGATEYTVAAGALKKRASSGGADGGTQIPDNCTVTAQVDRNRAGTLDSAYSGGTVTGIQRRTVTFTTTP